MAKKDYTSEELHNFQWFHTYTAAGLALPKTERLIFWGLLIEYGSLREEPAEFPSTKNVPSYVFKALFEGNRVNIDNSVKNSDNGKKGGRPKKSAAEKKNREEEPEEGTIEPAILDYDITDEPPLSGVVSMDWEEGEYEDTCPF